MVRLRKDGEIIGYMRESGSITLYSKDGYGWNGKAMPYDTTEESISLRDKNAKRLFLNDVISVKDKTNGGEELWIVQKKPSGEGVLLVKYNAPEETCALETVVSKHLSITRVGYVTP